MAEAPELPETLLPLWEDFLKLHTSRGVGMSGPAGISYRDIGYFQEVTKSYFTPWEVDVILKADREFFKALPKPKTAPGEGS
jgi:hypothetical protein